MRIYTNNQSFIAFFDYSEEEKTLLVTFKRTGQQFRYDKFPKGEFKKLQNSKNRGSYFANHINKRTATFEKFIPISQIENIYRSFKRQQFLGQ